MYRKNGVVQQMRLVCFTAALALSKDEICSVRMEYIRGSHCIVVSRVILCT
jgi:hypothetical protein